MLTILFVFWDLQAFIIPVITNDWLLSEYEKMYKIDNLLFKNIFLGKCKKIPLYCGKRELRGLLKN